MAEINTKTQPGDDPAFLSGEIREAAGWSAEIDTSLLDPLDDSEDEEIA